MKNLVLMCLFLIATCTFAAEIDATTKPQLLFGTEVYAPYNFVDGQTGQISGFSNDIVKALIAHAGDQDNATIEIYPWARIYYMAQHLENVGIFSMVRSKAREKMFKWVGVLYYPDAYIWKLRARTDIQVHNKADLKRYKTVVINDGIDYQILTREYGLSIDDHLLAITSTEQKLLMLTSGRAELFEYGELALRWKMHLMGIDFSTVEKVMPVPEMTSLSLAFSLKTDDAIVNKYRQALADIKQNGTYQKILYKWQFPAQ
ncbi:substrate-binding periplasmic protein [Thalassotalea fusca]